jgi:hypothetical protein
MIDKIDQLRGIILYDVMRVMLWMILTASRWVGNETIFSFLSYRCSLTYGEGIAGVVED